MSFFIGFLSFEFCSFINQYYFDRSELTPLSRFISPVRHEGIGRTALSVEIAVFQYGA